MKRFICSLLLLAGLVAAVCSCDNYLHTGDQTGLLYGTWALDKLTVGTGTSLIGDGSMTYTEVNFTDCYLTLNKGLIATANMGFDVDATAFSYDAEKKTIRFDESISVGNDGKAMVLVGTYNVTELTDNRLVLDQPDLNIEIPGIATAHQSASYAFHRLSVEN